MRGARLPSGDLARGIRRSCADSAQPPLRVPTPGKIASLWRCLEAAGVELCSVALPAPLADAGRKSVMPTQINFGFPGFQPMRLPSISSTRARIGQDRPAAPAYSSCARKPREAGQCECSRMADMDNCAELSVNGARHHAGYGCVVASSPRGAVCGRMAVPGRGCDTGVEFLREPRRSRAT